MEPRKSRRSDNNSSGRRLETSIVESVDRISALPDSILGVILSLLPTKNALATSSLSRRWDFVWRTVHNLDFCLVVDRGRTLQQIEEENGKFVGFVNHVLLHHDGLGILNKFRLVWTHCCIQSHVTSWIKTATTKSVRELSATLESYDKPFDMMPISIFSCNSLQSLKLNGKICLSAATVFCLPRLESLHLCKVTFESTDAFEKIIRGCPVLKYLHIDINMAGFVFIIASTSLRRLELYSLYAWSSSCLKLDVPSLEYLKLSVNFVPKQLSFVIEAEIWGSTFGGHRSYVDLVRALGCAKSLTLSCDVMRGFAYKKVSTDFKRLVRLEVHIYCCNWRSLQDFIQCSNNLQALTVQLVLWCSNPKTEHDPPNWATPVEVPICLSTSLKKFVFDGYFGHEERELIRYMLKHGNVLEVVQISCHSYKIRKNFELLQEICEFPRKSPDCEVKFFGCKSKGKVKAL